MILLSLTAPLIGFALMLFMHWLEEHTMAGGRSPTPKGQEGD
jgi:hypothetical protein